MLSAGSSPFLCVMSARPHGIFFGCRLATALVLALTLGGCSGFAAVSDMPTAGEGVEYEGWVVIRKNLREEQKMPGHFSEQELEDNDGWIFNGGLRWNTAGSRVPILVDGAPSGYEVELVELPYKERLTILKLAVYQQGRERALAYTWAEPGSANIGINLRWMQAGLTRSDK